MHFGAPTESEFEEGDCIPPQHRFYTDLLICKVVYLANILYIQTGISLVEVIHQILAPVGLLGSHTGTGNICDLQQFGPPSREGQSSPRSEVSEENVIIKRSCMLEHPGGH